MYDLLFDSIAEMSIFGWKWSGGLNFSRSILGKNETLSFQDKAGIDRFLSRENKRFIF